MSGSARASSWRRILCSLCAGGLLWLAGCATVFLPVKPEMIGAGAEPILAGDWMTEGGRRGKTLVRAPDASDARVGVELPGGFLESGGSYDLAGGGSITGGQIAERTLRAVLPRYFPGVVFEGDGPLGDCDVIVTPRLEPAVVGVMSWWRKGPWEAGAKVVFEHSDKSQRLVLHGAGEVRELTVAREREPGHEIREPYLRIPLEFRVRVHGETPEAANSVFRAGAPIAAHRLLACANHAGDGQYRDPTVNLDSLVWFPLTMTFGVLFYPGHVSFWFDNDLHGLMHRSLPHPVEDYFAAQAHSLALDLLVWTRGVRVAAAIKETRRRRAEAPAHLVWKEMQFDDDKGFLPDRAIEAGETARVTAVVENEGPGKAIDCKLRLESDNPAVVAQGGGQKDLGDLAPGETMNLSAGVRASLELKAGKATLTARVQEARHYGSAPRGVRVETRPYVAPRLEVGAALAPGEELVSGGTARIEVAVGNRGAGSAYGVAAHLEPGTEGVTFHPADLQWREIPPGRRVRREIEVALPRAFAGETVLLALTARDIRGEGVASRDVELPARAALPALVLQVGFKNPDGDPPRSGDGTRLTLRCQNRGRAEGRGVRLRLAIPALSWQEEGIDLGIIDPGTNQTRKIDGPAIPPPFAEKTVKLRVVLSQDDFPDRSYSKELEIEVTRPELLVHFQDGKLPRTETAELRFAVENRGRQTARDVVARLLLDGGKGVEVRGSDGLLLGDVSPGGKVSDRAFTLSANAVADPGALAGTVELAYRDFPPARIGVKSFSVVEKLPSVHDQPSDSGSPAPAAIVASHREPDVIFEFPTPREDDKTVHTAKGTLAIRVRVRADTEVDSKNVSVLRNSKPVEGFRGVQRGRVSTGRDSRKVRHFSFVVPLRMGLNIIEVVAKDSEGLEGRESLTVSRRPLGGEIWAVVIGISRYADPSLRLKEAADDARSFANYLQVDVGVPESHIVRLIDNDASLQEVMSKLTLGSSIAKKAAEHDIVVVYLAAHAVYAPGAGETYLLPQDVNRSDLAGSAYHLALLMRQLEMLETQRTLLVADVCNEGRLGSGARFDTGWRSTRPNHLIITAAGPTEVSVDGVFTPVLLDALRGAADADKDGEVGKSELQAYLSRVIIDRTATVQHPALYGSWDGAILPPRKDEE